MSGVTERALIAVEWPRKVMPLTCGVPTGLTVNPSSALRSASDVSDGGAGTGDQQTNAEFLDFIPEPDITDGLGSFTLDGLTVSGGATNFGNFLVIQEFSGGTFTLYDNDGFKLPLLNYLGKWRALELIAIEYIEATKDVRTKVMADFKILLVGEKAKIKVKELSKALLGEIASDIDKLDAETVTVENALATVEKLPKAA